VDHHAPESWSVASFQLRASVAITDKQGAYLALADLVSRRLSAALCLPLVGFNASMVFMSKQCLLVEKTEKYLLWGQKKPL